MSFPVHQCEEWQCRYVFPNGRCCLLQEGHISDHWSSIVLEQPESVPAGATTSATGAPESAQESSSELVTLRSLLQTTEAERDEYKTLAAIGAWHKDCRPNRHMAARELQKSQAVIDKLADTVSALRREIDSANVRLTSLTQAQQRLIEQWRTDASGTYMAGYYQQALAKCADDLARLGQAEQATGGAAQEPPSGT